LKKPTLEEYVRWCAARLGLRFADVARMAGVSRPTLYKAVRPDADYPNLTTIVAIASAIEMHPLKLLDLLFEENRRGGLQPRSPGDRSAFVRDATYADNDWVMVGDTFRKTWEILNSGTVPWEDRYLVCQDEELAVLSRRGEELYIAPNLVPVTSQVPVPPTEPGGTAQISVDFVAPNIPSTVLSYWKMTYPDGSLCFPEGRGLWAKVRVISLVMEATETPMCCDEIEETWQGYPESEQDA